jgi:cytohesin
MQAAGGGHLEMLQWARANGCPWNEKELHIAAQNGHEAVVQSLIEAGADVNKVNDNGMTPLYVGAQEGHEAILQALIEAGADISMATDTGWMPQYAAAKEGHAAVV